jgi:olefin beta-lactone synthetase
VMPVTDGTDAMRRSPSGGTATGWPLPGAEVVIVPLDDPTGPTKPRGEWGEILVHAPWMRDGYDRRWATDAEATVRRDGVDLHRTGDVGYLDPDGRLFQLGRRQHVVTTARGPVASVAAEQPLAAVLGRPAAVVGVGPDGTQALVVVVDTPGRGLRLADLDLTDRVRTSSRHDVAAVLEGPLPVDIRHQSKVDRGALAREAAAFLAGR